MTQGERITALEARLGKLEDEGKGIAALKVEWVPGVGGVFSLQRTGCPLDCLRQTLLGKDAT